MPAWLEVSFINNVGILTVNIKQVILNTIFIVFTSIPKARANGPLRYLHDSNGRCGLGGPVGNLILCPVFQP